MKMVFTPEADHKSGKPKLLVYVDRNLETSISLAKRNRRFTSKKHNEVVCCFQTKDGTEATKEDKPAIVITREKIDWSTTKRGDTVESVSQWRETFQVNTKAMFWTEMIDRRERASMSSGIQAEGPSRTFEAHLPLDSGKLLGPAGPADAEEWLAIEAEEALVQVEGECGDKESRPEDLIIWGYSPDNACRKMIIRAWDLEKEKLQAGGSSPSGEVLNTSRTQIVLEKKNNE